MVSDSIAALIFVAGVALGAVSAWYKMKPKRDKLGHFVAKE